MPHPSICLAAALLLTASPALAQVGGPVETRPRNAVALQPAFEGQTRAPEMTAGVAFRTEVVADGLNKPWGMTFLPDGRLLVTERTTIRILSTDGSLSPPIRGVPAVDIGDQGGVLDIVLDPAFAENRLIYFTFSEPGEPPLTSTAVARARLAEDGEGPRLEDLTIIFSQQPKLDSRQHYGGRLIFDAEGHLFVTTGERFVPAGRPQAQGLGSLLGKIIRINPDGSVPADNPFVNQAGARAEIWSYGHRNIQGAAIHPVTGRLWTIEHGPRGGDELNLPEAGSNHGWPIITYGIEYTGEPVGGSFSQQDGMAQPRYYWDPVIAPSGMAFYGSDAVPAWRNSLFIAALRGKHLARLMLDGDRVIGEERLLVDRNERLRDVEVGPDGALWVLTDGTDASLLKLTPTP
jgi:aldose sugar dehydrogenase